MLLRKLVQSNEYNKNGSQHDEVAIGGSDVRGADGKSWDDYGSGYQGWGWDSGGDQ